MSQRKISFLTLTVILIVTGVFFIFKKVSLLHIENMDQPRSIHIRISPSETFFMFYMHSIYNEPVVEEFQAERDSIALKGVRTKSPGVMEYYGFENMKETHPTNLKLGAILLLKRGMGEGQGLIVRDRKIYLSEIGERGSRIQLRVESMSLGEYFWWSLLGVPKAKLST